MASSITGAKVWPLQCHATSGDDFQSNYAKLGSDQPWRQTAAYSGSAQ
jgi:hypothetical protein